MLTLDVQAQSRALRRAATAARSHWLAGGFVVLAVALLGAALWQRLPALGFVAAFAAAAALSLALSSPHLRRAARALDAGIEVPGSVVIEVTTWTDAPTWHAVVADSDGSRWCFEFQPLGWTPAAGRHDAVLLMLPSLAWPALARTAGGLLIPRSRPARVGAP